MKQTWKNRDSDVYTFTADKDGNILWEGPFTYYRCGMPNDYTKAYKSYLKDTPIGEAMGLEDFKVKVHKYDNDSSEYVMGDKYVRLVESLKDKIDMIDPSGGPYISVGQDAGMYIPEFKGKTIKDFESIEKGFKIIL